MSRYYERTVPNFFYQSVIALLSFYYKTQLY